MKKKKSEQNQLSQQERRLIEQLRQHPEMMERVQSLLEIARNAEGPLKTADEVEELLIEEMRRLGNATLSHWAIQAEERVSEELKSQDPTVLSRKKKR
jgi:phosphoribosyl-dephospho-CoA transferase